MCAADEDIPPFFDTKLDKPYQYTRVGDDADAQKKIMHRTSTCLPRLSSSSDVFSSFNILHRITSPSKQMLDTTRAASHDRQLRN